jgi:hypothetical protein
MRAGKRGRAWDGKTGEWIRVGKRRKGCEWLRVGKRRKGFESFNGGKRGKG